MLDKCPAICYNTIRKRKKIKKKKEVKKMLWKVSYNGFVDFFRAGSKAEAEEKAHILSCGSSFSLTIIGY